MPKRLPFASQPNALSTSRQRVWLPRDATTRSAASRYQCVFLLRGSQTRCQLVDHVFGCLAMPTRLLFASQPNALSTASQKEDALGPQGPWNLDAWQRSWERGTRGGFSDTGLIFFSRTRAYLHVWKHTTNIEGVANIGRLSQTLSFRAKGRRFGFASHPNALSCAIPLLTPTGRSVIHVPGSKYHLITNLDETGLFNIKTQ